MESKITIHTGDDFKPVIKVIEKESEDVRDVLVVQMRTLLRHTSRTFTVEFIGVPDGERVRAAYYLCPVTEEIEYFKDIIIERLLGGLPEGPAQNNPKVKKIGDFFDWLKTEEHVFG